MQNFLKDRAQKNMAIFLVIAMILGVGFGHGYLTFAYEAQPGMIRSSDRKTVTTRTEPTDESEKRNGLEYGKPVVVTEEVTDAQGVLWYKLSYNLKAGGTSWGYCRAADVLLDKDIVSYAYGKLNANEVSLRDDAGTDRTNILIQVNQGEEVELLDSTTVDGKEWYRVRYTTTERVYIGWMRSIYIEFDRYNVTVDPAYIEELKTKGFPESYIDQLAVLHALYPEWVFEPVLTGLDWQAVIDGETLTADGGSRPINMVGVSYDDSMKSTHPDEYDWETNTWVIRDGNSWVAVHPDYLAYIMDPRNSLTEQAIFQFESLSYSESHTIEGVHAVIGSSFMSKDAIDSDGSIFSYAEAFMQIGKEVGVSPYHLVSRVKQEQGSGGTSSLISGTYPGFEGYYNYFNFGAHGVTNTAVIEAGLNYAKNQDWSTRYKALSGGAAMIAKNYIARGQDTLYFQKFNVVWDKMLYGHQYMGAVLAPSSEAKNIAKAYTDKHQAFVFRIPVYENMPEKAVEFTPTGSPNNYLSDLTVEGLSLSPTFRGAITEYTLTVDHEISSITVGATPVVNKSKVTGTKAYSLAVGENVIKIVCESESGAERIYTITVVREEATEVPDPTPDPDLDPDLDPNPNPNPEPNPEPNPDPSPTYTYQELDQVMYVISDVNVRDLPEKSGNSLGILVAKEEVRVTGRCNETGWYRIVYMDGLEGYVSADYLTTEAPKPIIPAGIDSSLYNIGTYVTGIAPETKAETFLAGIQLQGSATVRLLTKDGAVQTGLVGTGNVLQVFDGETLIKSYELVIYGDVSGDGRINTLDAIRLNRYTIGLATLSGAYLEAADANHDARVNTLDAIVINRSTIGLTTIIQKK